MKKFAIAHADLFDNEMKIYFVEGSSEFQALYDYALQKGYGELEDCADLEALKTLFWDCDELVEISELPE